MNERICLVVNPRAGAGAAGRSIDHIKQSLDRAFAQWDVRVTEGPRHATQIAQQVTEESFDIIAAVGGDGTCHEVVNGLLHEGRPRKRKLIFTVIPFGTGSDLVKSLRMPRSLKEALWVAATGITLPSDVGQVQYTRADGTECSEIFINVAGFGASGDVVRRANNMTKRLGGGFTFLSATVQSALSYQPMQVELSWDGPQGPGQYEGPLMSCFVANGAWCGGGMRVGSPGNLHNGTLDMTILPPAALGRQLVDLPKLYNGKIGRINGTVQARITHLEARVPGGTPAFIDLDGESPGELPVRFKALNRVIQLRGGWIHNPLLGSSTD